MSGDQLPGKVLIVDDDQTIANLVAGWFRSASVKTTKTETVSEMAWAESLRTRYHLIVLDWNLNSELNGIGLFNRWKQDEYYQDIPVLVISGYLSELDFSIVDEFPLVAKMAKPLDKDTIIQKSSVLFQQSSWYIQQKKNIEIVFKAMSRPDFMAQVLKVVKSSPSPFHILVAAGNILFQNERYQEALVVFKNALSHKKDSILVLNALGKISLHLGKTDDAKKYLSVAFKRSPLNLERLCTLGDICLQDLHPDKAGKLFSKALDLDYKSNRARDGKKLSKEADNWMKQFSDIPTSFASLLNSMGIARARSGQFKEGMEHYAHALRVAYDNQLKSKLSFNMGFGYMRWKKKDQAREWFKRAVDYDPEFKKAGDYLRKAESEKIPGPDDHVTFGISSRPDQPSSDPFGSDLVATLPKEPEATDADQSDLLAFAGEATKDLSTVLFTFIGNRKITARLFREEKSLIEIISETELNPDDKIVLNIDGKTFGLRCTVAKPVALQGKNRFFARLISLDQSVNLEDQMALIPDIPEKAAG